MYNWRKPVIYGLLYLTRSNIPKYLKEIKRIEKFSREEIGEYQKKKLKKLLLHAYKNVPYYHKVLAEVVVNNKVNLKNFDKIPILTKDIIRKQGKNLYSKDYKKRKSYENTSGGSTGESVKFLQDKEYWETNGIAAKIFFHELFGKKIGEPEINLWGSERDIYRNSLSLKERTINFLYNRKFLNAFKVDDNKLKNFFEQINKLKPVSMWVYVESIDLLANFIRRNKLKIHSPKFIISTAGTLYPEIRKNVEEVFKSPVYNQYGSREAGVMGIECKNKNGLHGFPYLNYMEIINNEIIVTLLTNYSMPLIRYKIGDTAEKSKTESCDCGRNFKIFKNITGRTISHFKTKNGKIIHGQYFIHQFYFLEWVKRFQIVQKQYDLIICNIILEKQENKRDIERIINQIKLVMGRDCKVEFKFIKEIKPTKSGKYLYTVCELK